MQTDLLIMTVRLFCFNKNVVVSFVLNVIIQQYVITCNCIHVKLLELANGQFT